MEKVYKFNYKAEGQSVTLPPGKYKLECWGASGGVIADLTSLRNKGGYASGELTLKREKTLYIYTGQYGGDTGINSILCSFNGGGSGSIVHGGGATDIRLVGSGSTWNYSPGYYSRIIVAGGAGGIVIGYSDGNGGGEKGDNGNGRNNSFSPGATQYDAGRGNSSSSDGNFGLASGFSNQTVGGGGGWFGGASGSKTSSIAINAGGGSGYVLTKDSYRPKQYTPTSEYWMENPVLTTGGNDNGDYGYAQITLLQALPIIDIISYSSAQATFKANHTDKTSLAKIEVFIDDILKETITTDLYEEKTINYTLEDNALHTLKIVATDNVSAIAEKVVSISKSIVPLENDATLNNITSKVTEIKDGLKNGKTSITNVLSLKNIESSLNNTFVELSEKIKTSFDISDTNIEKLQNQLTEKNNTITQLNNQITNLQNHIGKIATFNGDLTMTKDSANSGSCYINVSLDFKPDIVIYQMYDYNKNSGSENKYWGVGGKTQIPLFIKDYLQTNKIGHISYDNNITFPSNGFKLSCNNIESAFYCKLQQYIAIRYT